MKAKLSESHVQRQILDWLERKGIFHYRQNTGVARLKGFHVRFGTRGAPDIVAIYRGMYVGIEVKKLGKLQTEEQKTYMQNVRHAGGMYILAYEISDVTRVLES